MQSAELVPADYLRPLVGVGALDDPCRTQILTVGAIHESPATVNPLVFL